MTLDCKIHSKDPELALFIYGHGVLTFEDVQGFDEFFNRFLNGSVPFKVFFDLRKLKSAPMDVIKSLVKHMVSFESRATEKVVATSVLVGSKPIESVLNLLFSFRKPTTPTKVTSTLEEACEFLDEYDC